MKIEEIVSQYTAERRLKEAGDLEPQVPDKAVVCKVRGKAMLLYFHGTGLEYWESVAGRDGLATDIGEDIEEKDGVFVWEGKVRAHTDYWGEHDEWLEGTSRDISDEEWELIRNDDVPPWDKEAVAANAAWHKRVDEAEKKLHDESKI